MLFTGARIRSAAANHRTIKHKVMKDLFVALAITLAFFHLAIAPTPAAQPQSDGAKSAELQEALLLSNQVVALYNKDQFDEAMPLAKRALEIRERLLGAGDPLTGDAVQNLASLYFGKNNYGEALSLYKRALAIFEKALGAENAKAANTIHNMGWLYAAQGDSGRAEESFQRALAIRTKVLGPNHISVAQSLDILAQFYQQQVEYAKAVEYYKRALNVKEKALGPNHKDVADLATRCACAMMQNRQDKEAAEMQKRASMILHGSSPDSATSAGSVIQGKATARVEPIYPAAAKRARIEGTVVIEVTVDENGKVIDAKSLCGPDILARSSIEAARGWRFTPTLVNGVVVKVVGTITFHFHI